jgi:hypothetical protein
MKITMALGFALALAIPSALASAAELPPIKVTSSNQVARRRAG